MKLAKKNAINTTTVTIAAPTIKNPKKLNGFKGPNKAIEGTIINARSTIVIKRIARTC